MSTAEGICKCGHHKELHEYKQTSSNFDYTECKAGVILTADVCPHCNMKQYKENWYKLNSSDKVFQQCLCNGFEPIRVIYKDIWDSKAGRFWDPTRLEYNDDIGTVIKVDGYGLSRTD